jgi:hypothetical protein
MLEGSFARGKRIVCVCCLALPSRHVKTCPRKPCGTKDRLDNDGLQAWATSSESHTVNLCYCLDGKW